MALKLLPGLAGVQRGLSELCERVPLVPAAATLCAAGGAPLHCCSALVGALGTPCYCVVSADVFGPPNALKACCPLSTGACSASYCKHHRASVAGKCIKPAMGLQARAQRRLNSARAVLALPDPTAAAIASAARRRPSPPLPTQAAATRRRRCRPGL